jgi:hypothetical protein
LNTPPIIDVKLGGNFNPFGRKSNFSLPSYHFPGLGFCQKESFMVPQFPIWFTGVSLMLVFSMSASIAFADGQRPGVDPKGPTTLPSPKPELSPKAVTKIVLDALSKNDANDTGIKTTFKFASPGNQQATGPIERFIPMVKSPQYAPLVNSRSVEVRELTVDEDSAAELAVVTDSNGDKAFFIFQLSKQADGDLKDCWMTDGVMRVEPSGAPADAPPAPKPDKPDRKLPDGQFPA